MKRICLLALLLGGCGDASVNLVPPPGNYGGPTIDPPVAVADGYGCQVNAQVNTTAANGVLANDFPRGGAITVTGPIQTTRGNVTLNADGSFLYTPAAGFLGNDTFSYTLHNSAGNSTANVLFTVQ